MLAERRAVTIRKMEIGDIPRVLEIDRSSFAVPWSERTYRYELTRNKSAELYVAELDGGIVGYVGTWRIIDECHISTLAVDEGHRRRGIARRLLEHALEIARARGVRAATLEVRISNEPAIDLYRKYGFEITGRRKAYYRDNGEDAYIMTLSKLRQFESLAEGALGRP